MDFITDSSVFIQENLDNILIVLLFMVVGFIYIVLNNVKFDNLKTTKVTKEITYENMENMDDVEDVDEASNEVDDLKSDSCDSLSSDPAAVEKYCSTLNPELCKYKKCCILGSNKSGEKDTTKCVVGDSTGPTYQSDDNGNEVNFDYYYYENKCYGNCPDKE